MRASKALSVLPPIEVPVSPWRVEAVKPRRWSFRGLFVRRQPTLFQRCLAVHIHYASEQRSLH